MAPGARIMLSVGSLAITSGCSGYFWNAPLLWSMRQQLQSIKETKPHGELILDRSDVGVYITVDGQAAFRKDMKVVKETFRLVPGLHKMAVQYRDGNRYSNVLGSHFFIEKDKITYIDIEVQNNHIILNKPITVNNEKEYNDMRKQQIEKDLQDFVNEVVERAIQEKNNK